MKYRKSLVLFSLFAMNLVDQPTSPIVLDQGIVTGIVSADGSIFEYMGIPYGAFNETNRFQAPYPPPKWEGTLKAIEHSTCPHYSFSKFWGKQDCLKVNVYVPATATKPVPVMVFIHGGGFTAGSGGKLLYGPEFIVKHGVILVTLNYRLDILGFLCLGIKEAPGNAALKDQIAALRWVKKNIAAFGGDPDNVTVFGQSAGAVMVSLLHASKLTNGLFNKVIIQSGSSFANWALNMKPILVASVIAKELGHDTKDPYKLYELFSQMPYETLLVTKPKRPLDKFLDPQFLHLPCIERKIPGVESVIDDLPYNLLRDHPKNIPMIYSSLNKEGRFILYTENVEIFEEKKDMYLFASDLVFDSDEEAAEVAKTVKEFYFGQQKPSKEMEDNVTDFCTQIYFEMPIILESEIVLKYSNAPVYNSIFEYIGERNFMKYSSRIFNKKGACHSDDLLYLFNGKIWISPISKTDKIVIDHMTKFWTNFAKYGDPTPPLSQLPIRWEPSAKSTMKFFYISDQLRLGSLPNPEGYNLWKNIYQKYRRKDLDHYLP